MPRLRSSHGRSDQRVSYLILWVDLRAEGLFCLMQTGRINPGRSPQRFFSAPRGETYGPGFSLPCRGKRDKPEAFTPEKISDIKKVKVSFHQIGVECCLQNSTVQFFYKSCVCFFLGRGLIHRWAISGPFIICFFHYRFALKAS